MAKRQPKNEVVLIPDESPEVVIEDGLIKIETQTPEVESVEATEPAYGSPEWRKIQDEAREQYLANKEKYREKLNALLGR